MSPVERIRRAFGRGVGVFAFARAAPFYARYTVRFHLPAEVLLGLYSGIFMLADLVSRKTLHASDLVLTLQTSVPTMTLVLAMVWRDLLAGRDRRRVVALTGWFGKGLLVLAAFITTPGIFLALVIAFALVDSAFIPLRNAIFRANYHGRVRGRIFGGVVSMMNLALVAANLASAFLLDHHEQLYRVLFPVAGVIGLVAHLIYSRIRVRGDGPQRLPRTAEAPGPILTRLHLPLARAWRVTIRILRADPLFAAYEGGFFIYGLAFLMNLPLVVMLIVDELNLPYEQAAFGRFVIGQVMLILLSPFAGRLLDRSHPARLMAGACLLLTLHAGLLAITGGFGTLVLAYVVYGIAMTGVNLAWNLGPMHFAPTEKESTDYMAVLVSLTGVRGMLGPLVALGAKWLFGLRAAFVVSAILFAIAAILMARLSRRIRAAQGDTTSSTAS